MLGIREVRASELSTYINTRLQAEFPLKNNILLILMFGVDFQDPAVKFLMLLRHSSKGKLSVDKISPRMKWHFKINLARKLHSQLH